MKYVPRIAAPKLGDAPTKFSRYGYPKIKMQLAQARQAQGPAKRVTLPKLKFMDDA